MTELLQRTLTGLGLVTVILSAVWYGPYTFALLILLMCFLSIKELYNLLDVPGAQPSLVFGMLLSGSLILTSFATASGLLSWRCMLINLPIAFGAFLDVLYRPAKESPFEGLALTFFGVTAISVPLSFFVAGAFLDNPLGVYQFELPMGYFLLLWSHDSGAYVVGRNFGRHPLFSRISPKKTWEGSIGGTVVALVAASIVSRYFPVLTLQEWITLAAIVILTGTYGDFLKSLLKRSRGVKDSGTILPGHGGMLDRFDSLIGSAPFVFSYLILLNNG